MTVIELAQALGEGIKKDPIMIAYNEAKKAYEENAEIQGSLVEYNAQRTALGEEFKKELEKQDKIMIEMIQKRVDELYVLISEHPVYLAFMEAQAKFSNLMKSVNSEISFVVFGERPCTHDCSSCHADCSSKK